MRAAQPVAKDGPRINEEIRSREVQLIDQTGHNHGPTDTQVALARAQEAGLDLVEIAPNSVPPVVKILRLAGDFAALENVVPCPNSHLG